MASRPPGLSLSLAGVCSLVVLMLCSKQHILCTYARLWVSCIVHGPCFTGKELMGWLPLLKCSLQATIDKPSTSGMGWLHLPLAV